MTSSIREFIEAEIGTLDEMLADIEPGRVIERSGLERRRARLAKELAELPPELPRVVLTFAGEPVLDRHGILADFGGKAAALFSEAVATVSASLTTTLGRAGRIPQAADRQLRIVGTAHGSFGFELEMPPPNPQELPGVLPQMSDAIEATLAMIREAAAGNSDELSRIIADTDARAAAKVQSFVKHVIDRRATFAARFGEHRVAVRDETEARTAFEALREDQIRQEEETKDCTLLGVFPEALRFELRTDQGVVLHGRIDHEAGDPAELQSRWLNKRVRARFRVTRLRNAHPSYVLLSLGPSEDAAPS
ncbi:MAG: hypothetical protein IT378_23065 [Sandaracinaceae bacterium]|nr:hypothetical protein [Sandaracinaceae bacterium]